MKERDEIGIDRFRSRHSVPPMTVNVGRPGRFAARALLSLFVLLLLAAVMLAAPIASPAQTSVSVSVTFGPPALPVYVQPPCPDSGFIWVPGYWAWDPDYGYYWVPGVWVPAPFVGMLWTPGYWAWNNGVFIWYEGYWAPVVGYYGGINYGYGYTSYGYAGGYWSGERFYYNRTVNNINVTNITTVYSKPVENVRPAGVSFNGGPGGTKARPTSEQLAAARERHSSLSDAQVQHIKIARTDPRQRAKVNNGRPAIAATMKPGEFTGRGVVPAERAGAPYKAPPVRKAAPGERVRTTKPGAETPPPVTAPERRAPGTPREAPERGVNEPRRTPQRPETTKPSQPEEETKGKAEMRQPGTAPERMAPGTPREGSERGVNEPRRTPQRPETAKPSPEEKTKDEKTKDEKEGPQ